jgi:DNA repair exonuclease SbcCD ATPase subunit
MSKELAKALAQKLGVSEEDAVAALSLVGEDSSDLANLFNLVGATGEAMSKAPQDVQRAITPVISMALLKQLSTDPYQQKMLALVSSLATLKTLFSSDQGIQQLVNTITQQLNTLNERLQKLEEGRKAEELQKLEDFLNMLTQEVSDLKKRIEQPPQTQTQTQGSTNPLKAIEQFMEQLQVFPNTLNAMVEYLKALGYKVRRPGEEETPTTITPEVIEEYARKYGYEVRRMTPEEIRKTIEEERKKAFKKAMRQLQIKEKELAFKEKVYNGLASLTLSFIREVIGPIVKQRLGAVTEEELAKAIDMRLKEVAGQSGQEVSTSGA